MGTDECQFATTPTVHMGGRLIQVSVEWKKIGITIHINAIYAPADRITRKLFIEELGQRISKQENTIIIGDFNSAPNNRVDRWPPSESPNDWNLYAELAAEKGLVDLVRFKNRDTRIWTWTRPGGTQRSRIDHILTTRNLAHKCTLPRTTPPPRSDHWPIVTSIKVPNKRPEGRGIWKMNNSHLQTDAFTNIVLAKWGQMKAGILTEVPQNHEAWNDFKESIRAEAIRFGVHQKRRLNIELSAEMNELRKLLAAPPETNDDIEDEHRAWVERVAELEANVKERVKSTIEARRIRSRARWTEEGEKSTRYFFQVIRARSGFASHYQSPAENKNTSCDSTEVLGEAYQFYKELYRGDTTRESAQTELLEQWHKRIEADLRDLNDSDIQETEVREAISEAPTNSSPGPDGITFEFYKKFVDILAPALTNLYNSSRRAGYLPTSFGRSHIILIPKKGDLTNISNWRPISLTDCDVKILTKVLAKRLQIAAQTCIDPTQTGFVKGRSIFDNIFTMKMTIEAGTIDPTKICGGMVLLDQQKAYDRVDHRYLIKCLHHVGIGEGFTKWIRMLYSQAEAAVKLGPLLTRRFPIERGLRQGDPLSPILYNFIAEPFLCYLRNKNRGIQLPGLQLRTLAFADDVAIGVGDEKDADNLRKAIELHEWASNARVNEEKTATIKIGNPQFTLPWNPILPGEVTKYLGIPFTTTGIEPETLLGNIREDIANAVHAWRHRKLSLQGRTLLVNACLLAKVWFAAHVIPIPEAYLKDINKIVREFLWNGKLSKVPFDVVTMSKKAGGLGLLPLKTQAQAILCGWMTKAFRETNRPPWARVAEWIMQYQLSKAKMHISILCTTPGQAPRLPNSIPEFWRSSLIAWQTFKGQCNQVDETWHPIETLTLPLQNSRDIDVTHVTQGYLKEWRKQNIHTLGQVLKWDPEQRNFVTGESTEERQVAREIIRGKLRISSRIKERLIWKLTRMPTSYPTLPYRRLTIANSRLDLFTPKKAREFLHSHGEAKYGYARWGIEEKETLKPPSWSSIWKMGIEAKQRSLLWLIYHGAVTTRQKLSHFVPDLTNLCPVCEESKETLRHYFFECQRIKQMWIRITQFLNDITCERPNETAITIEEVFSGMASWQNKIPNIQALHALALWQVYRAHAEASLDGKKEPPATLFARWKGEVIQRITHDFNMAKQKEDMNRFTKVWTRVRCQWFIFDSGGDGKLVFHSRYTPLPP